MQAALLFLFRRTGSRPAWSAADGEIPAAGEPFRKNNAPGASRIWETPGAFVLSDAQTVRPRHCATEMTCENSPETYASISLYWILFQPFSAPR